MLSKTEIDRIGSWVRDLADSLGLRDWVIAMSHEPADDPSGATVCPIDGRKRATIRVNSEFFEYTPQDQRNIIIHELLHCHLHAAHRALVTLGPTIGTVAYEITEANHRDAIEIAVDAIAESIAGYYPLPPEKKKEDGDRGDLQGTGQDPPRGP